MLFRDQRPAAFRVKVVEKFVAARSQRSNSDHTLAISSHDFFDTQAHTLEFHRCRIEVLDAKLDWHIRRRMNFRWLETVVLNVDRHSLRLLRCRRTSARN